MVKSHRAKIVGALLVALALGMAGITVEQAASQTAASPSTLWIKVIGEGRVTSFSDDGRYMVTMTAYVYDQLTEETTYAAVSSEGEPANAECQYNIPINGIGCWATISGDGRYVAFDRAASNLVAGDTNEKYDVFVRDRELGITSRVSVASDGTQSNDHSIDPIVSADGRYVAFTSNASNLVADDTNGKTDIFVHDRQTGITSRVSVASDGTQGDDESFLPALSADGRYVAFISRATNLVADDTNDKLDVFVHDRQTGVTSRVSVAPDGTQGSQDAYSSGFPLISADGRFVVFETNVALLTNHLFLHDRQTTTTTAIPLDGLLGSPSGGFFNLGSISSDGRFVTFGPGICMIIVQGRLQHYLHFM